MATKTRSTGSDVSLLMAFETGYGTPPDASGGGVFNKMLFASSTLGEERPLGEDPLLGQGRNAQDPFYEAATDDGDIVVPVDLRGFGYWLKLVFGEPVTTDNLDGTFTHVFEAGKDLPSAFIDIGHVKLTTPKHFQHKGVKANTLAYNMSRSGALNATIGLIAQGESLQAEPVDAAPEAFQLRRFNQTSGSIKVGNTQLGNVTGGSFSFSNNLDPIETIRNDGLIDGADEAEAKPTGTIDVRFGIDSTLTDPINAETPVSLSYSHTMPGAEGFLLKWDMPRVFLPKKKPSVSGPGGITASYDWQAAFDLAEGYTLRVTLKNDVETY